MCSAPVSVYCVFHVLSVSCEVISQLQSCMESFISITPSFKSLHLYIQAPISTRLCLAANRDNCSFGMLEQGLFLLHYTSMWFFVLPGASLYFYICGSLYFYVLLCTSMWFFVLLCVSLYFYVFLCTSTYVLLCTFVSCVVCVHLCTCTENY